MPPLRSHTSRIGLAVGFGLIMFVVSCLAAWISLGSAFYNNSLLHSLGPYHLRIVSATIQGYTAAKGSPPASIAELELPTERGTHDYTDVLHDGWGHPMAYSVHGASWTLTCYGRDGKPGGVLLDEDLSTSSGATEPPRFSGTVDYTSPQWHERPSLDQFFFELPTRGVVAGCALSGLVSFVTALALAFSKRRRGTGAFRPAMAIAVTILMALFIGAIVCQLHIPSRH